MRLNILIILGIILLSSVGSAAIIEFDTSTPLHNSMQNSTAIPVSLKTDSSANHFTFLNFDDSLTLWLQMESGSSSLEDTSSYNNDANIQGEVPISSAKFGNAATFDRENYLEVSDSSSLKSKNLTVSVWVKANSLNQYSTVLMKSSNFDWDDGYGISYYDGGINFFVNDFEQGYVRGSISSDTWTHIVGTYDGKNVKLYINGELASTRELNAPLSHSSSSLLIGRGAIDEESYWPGMLDELVIHNRALTAAEIKSLYNTNQNTYSATFTNLALNNYTLKGYFKSESGEQASTEERKIIITNGTILNTNEEENNENPPNTEDKTSPQITVLIPVKDQVYNFDEMGELTLSVQTNESAYCNYTLDAGKTNQTMNRNSAGTSFSSIYLFEAKNRTLVTYHFVADCRDNAGNKNTTDIRFYANFTAGNTSATDGPTFITVISPQRDKVYNLQQTDTLNLSIRTQNQMDVCNYTLDAGKTNYTMAKKDNNNFSASYLFEAKNRTFDTYHFIATCMDSAGNINMSNDVRFFTNFTRSNNVGSSFISILSPQATNYSLNNYLVNISLSENGSCFYTLDSGITNKTLLTENNLTFTSQESNVANGNYTLNAYCRKEMNNTLNLTESSSVVFSISIPASQPQDNSPASSSSTRGGSSRGGSSTTSSSSGSSSTNVNTTNTTVQTNTSNIITSQASINLTEESEPNPESEKSSTNELVTLEQEVEKKSSPVSRITGAVVGAFDSAKQSRYGGLYLVLALVILTAIIAAGRVAYQKRKT